MRKLFQKIVICFLRKSLDKKNSIQNTLKAVFIFITFINSFLKVYDMKEHKMLNK